MYVRMGWTAESGTTVTMAPAGAAWCALQQRPLRIGQQRRGGTPFSDAELVRLSFVRWLYHTDRLDPPGFDNV